MKSGINSLNKFVPFSLIFDQSAAEWNQKRVGVSLCSPAPGVKETCACLIHSVGSSAPDPPSLLSGVMAGVVRLTNFPAKEKM